MKSIIWLDDLLDNKVDYLAAPRTCFKKAGFTLLEAPTVGEFLGHLRAYEGSSNLISAFVLDVMLTHKIEQKTWADYDLPEAFRDLKFLPQRAGIQLLEIFLSADWDSSRPSYIEAFRRHPFLIVTAYGGIDQQMNEHIQRDRRQRVSPAVVKHDDDYLESINGFLRSIGDSEKRAADE